MTYRRAPLGVVARSTLGHLAPSSPDAPAALERGDRVVVDGERGPPVIARVLVVDLAGGFVRLEREDTGHTFRRPLTGPGSPRPLLEAP